MSRCDWWSSWYISHKVLQEGLQITRYTHQGKIQLNPAYNDVLPKPTCMKYSLDKNKQPIFNYVFWNIILKYIWTHSSNVSLLLLSITYHYPRTKLDDLALNSEIDNKWPSCASSCLHNPLASCDVTLIHEYKQASFHLAGLVLWHRDAAWGCQKSRSGGSQTTSAVWSCYCCLAT